MKILENAEMQETILLLRRQLNTVVGRSSTYPEGQNLSMLGAAALDTGLTNSSEKNKGGKESPIDATTPNSVISLNRIFSQDDSKDCNTVSNSNSQAAEIEDLKQENVRLAEERDGLEIQSQKLAEEASYAKELAAAAAVELRTLTEEVAKLSYQNAKLIDELDSVKEIHCRSDRCKNLSKVKQKNSNYAGCDSGSRKPECQLIEDLKEELNVRYQREALLQGALSEKEQVDCELQTKLDEAKRHEQDLRNEISSMWSLIEDVRNYGIERRDIFPDKITTSNFRPANSANGFSSINSSFPGGNEIHEATGKMSTHADLKARYLNERRRSQELENLISRLKGEDLIGLDMAALEELQNVHVEAITKICQAKYANQIL